MQVKIEPYLGLCKEYDNGNNGKSFPLGVMWGLAGIKAAEIGLTLLTGYQKVPLDTAVGIVSFGLAAYALENAIYHLNILNCLNGVKDTLLGNRQPTNAINN